MPRRPLERIRDAVRSGAYDLTHHAVEEMAEDDLSILDVERAVLNGDIVKTETDSLRGPKYTIIGLAQDQETRVGVVGRFVEVSRYLIITVYEVTELGER